jgi:1-acyl-sn-glycerol-3-phosphate acyltransferase
VRLLQFSRRAPGRPRHSTFLAWTVIALSVLAFFRVFYRLRRRGLANVPRTGPLLYVANHQSHYDPPMVGVAVIDRPFASMARASLFDFRPFGWLISVLGAVPLSRGGRGDKAALTLALEELRAGRCVLIFPEGSRSRTGVLGTFHRGFMLLVKRSGAPVVPVAVEGPFDVWPITRPRPRLRGRLLVEVGTPIPAADLLALDTNEAVEHVKRTIETMRLGLRSDLRELTRGRFPPPGPGDVPYWAGDEPELAKSAAPNTGATADA